jgi:hypothetical protein
VRNINSAIKNTFSSEDVTSLLNAPQIMLQQTTEEKAVSINYENYLMSANPQEEFDNEEFPQLTQIAETNQNHDDRPKVITEQTINSPPPKENPTAWTQPIRKSQQMTQMEQIQYCLKITQETSDKSDKQRKDLEETKQLLDASNKLVCQVSQRVQEMSQQMNVVTATITGLAKSVNEIARFMNINNQIYEPPQSGQPPTQIIPNLTPQDTTNTIHNHTTAATTKTRPPHKQEGSIT